ncbi:cell division protein FtsZ [Stagnihabitans tardus]|uniref:Cell division protein FtsZ n=1 Tax=Stagnihabitans tardus TaxID=2699202 RepID=A0AAE4Y707_9RHOB|nr:cell division protein FtsZ [Stagnihabitans tardus]NBZ87042.1 cell division protein FtsZ [Stagnihabitans tardus]
MALNLTVDAVHEDLKPRITVFGVGGAGGNAVNNMIEKNLEGVEFVVANTDAQALQQSRSGHKIQIGLKVTEGLGAGARPSVGAAAAEESIEQIVDHLAGAHMCFITAGMGGGTGTGAAPIIAQAARELGVLTVGVVTKPFQFEGNKRMRQAEEGIEALQKVVDTLIVIPNQNLFRLANERTTFTEAFAMADDVLYQGVKGVTDLMVRPGLINLDFADVRAVMDEMGKAMMGTGEASGQDRAVQAAEKAIANPLLDEISLNGAKGVLINITGGYDLTLFELDEAANIIREKVDPDANIIVGSTLDPTMEGTLRVSVVATGIDLKTAKAETPVARRPMGETLKPAAARPAPEPMTLTQPVAQPAPAPAPAFEPEQASFRAPEPVEELDEMPAPAYRPAPEQRPVAAREPDASSYIAPRPRAMGTPSPEAMARLQAAVSKTPAAPAAAARPAAPAPKPAAKPVAERPRFGIGGLINRMAGSHAEAAPARQQPQVSAYDEENEPATDQDRMEIPAFLRRQAN